jgi:hypothetical protein
MPNWVANSLVITGEDKSLNALREQLSQPYHQHHYDVFTDSISHTEVEGQFLLWNIVRPTNLQAYYEYDRLMAEAEARKNAEATPSLSPEEMMEKLSEAVNNVSQTDLTEFTQKFQNDVEVGQDWYHWNIREWGTKWEISDSAVSQKKGELIYEFATAWSPPVPALNKLAAQYPKLVFTTRFHDEGNFFAGEVHWRDGKQVFEQDLNIDHALLEEMYGSCHACESDENDPDDGYAEMREEYKCAEYKAISKIVEEL